MRKDINSPSVQPVNTQHGNEHNVSQKKGSRWQYLITPLKAAVLSIKKSLSSKTPTTKALSDYAVSHASDKSGKNYMAGKEEKADPVYAKVNKQPLYAKVNKNRQSEKLNTFDSVQPFHEEQASTNSSVSTGGGHNDPGYASIDDVPGIPPRITWTEEGDSGYARIDDTPGNAGLTDSIRDENGALRVEEEDPYSVIPDDSKVLEEPEVTDSNQNEPIYATVNKHQLNKEAPQAWFDDPDYASLDESGRDTQVANASDEHPDIEEDGYQRLPGDEEPLYETLPGMEENQLFSSPKLVKSTSLDTGMDQVKDESLGEDLYETLADFPPQLPPKPAKLTKSASSEGQLDQLDVKSKQPRKLPLAGLVNWAKGAKDKHAEMTGLESAEARTERVQNLMDRCNKPGDAIVLTFRGGRHSAILVYDDVLKKSVYLSFGAEKSYKERGGGSQELEHDIYGFQDMMAEKNMVKLEGMDNQAILKKWRGSVKNKSFNVLTRNCSSIIKKLVLAGSENALGKGKLEHDRHWQMPSNTLNLALEIKNKMNPSP
ncbi:hypothetical protein [Endozoicomonas sp.]|uniref:hypothetical protein n=1 Tax=Endozoicomonas sp. TaxID=1892382 RepID=UPI002884053B|nr:hypothetical protein [Endozoicomonas sp.]